MVDGLSVRYRHAGHGPPLVFIHGLLGYSFSWRFAIPLLARGREVFAPDMPGAGFSDCDATLDCTLTGAARRLSRFLDCLGIETCDLVGSSYGGTTSLKLATQAPHRVRTLTLVSPANPWSRIGRKRLAALHLPGIRAIFPPLARRMGWFQRHCVRRMYGDRARLSSETLHGYSLPLVRPGVFEHALKITHSWHSDMAELKTELFRAAGIPVLMVWGSRDRLVDIDSAISLGGHFTESSLAVIDGAGHLPYEEVPEQFCKPVQEFIDAHSAARVPGGK